MADTEAYRQENGENHRKRRETLSGGESMSKKIKLEDETPPEANPNTIEAVREKNKALEIDMKEKNRRIVYLTKKCEALYRSREITSASFRCLKKHWFQLQDDLLAAIKTVDPSSVPDEMLNEAWLTALEAIDDFGQVRVRAEELVLNLPEWFITVTKDAEMKEPDADVSLPTDDDINTTYIQANELSKMEAEVYDQLKQKSEVTRELLQKLLAIVANAARDKLKPVEYAHIIQEKRAAVAQTLDLKGQLQTCKTRIAELERDVEWKETERHQACRDYDRLSAYIEQRGSVKMEDTDEMDTKSEQVVNTEKACETIPTSSTGAKSVTQEALEIREMEHAKIVATLRENMGILSSKLYQERQKLDSTRLELEKCKTLEVAWKNDEAALVEEHQAKVKQLRDEKALVDEEYSQLLLKSKVAYDPSRSRN
ncbi:hypothetical protein PsorP6_003727 [Peronosclerospora sorghi]|uniref:Uncharacterized protein n=1 Tax=Peronosclerospora sorghi TaxID=230839 RepID=A0ACC0VR86_9STRA|nr:hypothetical protein PsorP6_003727 [Peronosclerospora sorghi]